MMLATQRFSWRLYVAACVVGAVAGAVGAAFHALLEEGAAQRSAIRFWLDNAPVPGWLLLMAAGALILVFALWLVRRFAPEAAGSGVQEVEALLAGERPPLRWRRVLPVKFFAGTLAVGSGLVLGREGPTIHMGAALGQMTSERLKLQPRENRALIAAGAAAGLATAFNAPLASIVFVTEELRDHFEYRFDTIQSVILACSAAVVVSGWLLGQGPDMPLPGLQEVPLETAPLFLLLGVLIGSLGVLFNHVLLGSVSAFRALSQPSAYLATALAGMLLGALIWFAPATVGGGEHLLEALLHGSPGLLFLIVLLAVRLLTTVGSYGLGLPGGIFAPMLALGTICGAAFAGLVNLVLPASALDAEVFAVAAMGALFAATVRAPLTGIILVIELTGAQALALPIILTCLTATFTAQGLGGRPIYSSLLGLSTEAAPRKPVLRIGFAAALLGAVIAIEQIDVAWEGTGIGPHNAVTAAVPHLDATSPPAPEPALRPSSRPSVSTTARPFAAAQAGAAEHARPPSDAPDATHPERLDAQTRTSATATTTATWSQSARAQDTTAAQADETEREQPSASADITEPSTPKISADIGQGTPDQTTIPADRKDPTEGAAERYSIQLASFRNPNSLVRFAEQQGLTGQALRLDPAPAQGQWRAVLLGRYDSREAAEAALTALPPTLTQLAPVVRSLGADQRLTPIQP